MTGHFITGNDPRIPSLARLGDDALEALSHALRVYDAALEAGPDGHPWEADADQLPLLRRLIDAAILEDADAVVPGPCTSCAATMDTCDRKLATTGRPCCGGCHVGETHGDTDFVASCARMNKVRSELGLGTHG